MSEIIIPYFEIYIFIYVSFELFKEYLNYRQYLKNLQKEMPEEIKPYFEEKVFKKTQKYKKAMAEFVLLKSFVHLSELVVALWIGILPKIWEQSISLANKIVTSPYLDKTGMIIFILYFLILNMFFDLPFDLYHTFVIEENHKMNKISLKLFIKDNNLQLILSWIIASFLFYFILIILEMKIKYFYLYIWALTLAFGLLFTVIFPHLIQPCFNKVVPLEEGSLKEKILVCCKKEGFPLKKIYVIDGSTRSAHSNAYFYGFFTKHIVLFDTLIKNLKEEEIIAVLWHEIGHWKYWHDKIFLFIAMIYVFGLLFIFSLITQNSYIAQCFGFYSFSNFVSFVIFCLLVNPTDFILRFFMFWISRRNERIADLYAVTNGYGQELKNGLIKLTKDNLGNLNPDPYYSLFNYTHPTIVDRIKCITMALKLTNKND